MSDRLIRVDTSNQRRTVANLMFTSWLLLFFWMRNWNVSNSAWIWLKGCIFCGFSHECFNISFQQNQSKMELCLSNTRFREMQIFGWVQADLRKCANFGKSENWLQIRFSRNTDSNYPNTLPKKYRSFKCNSPRTTNPMYISLSF